MRTESKIDSVERIYEIVRSSSLKSMTKAAQEIMEEREPGDVYEDDGIRITVADGLITALIESTRDLKWYGLQFDGVEWFAFDAESGAAVDMEFFSTDDMSMAAYYMQDAAVGTYIPEFESFAPSCWASDKESEAQR